MYCGRLMNTAFICAIAVTMESCRPERGSQLRTDRPRRVFTLVASLLIIVFAADGCHVYDKQRVDPVQQPPAAGVTAPVAGVGAAGSGAVEGGSAGSAGSAAPAFNPETCHGGDCWWSVTNPDGCKSAGLPLPRDRPDSAGDGRQDVGAIYMGFSKLRIGQTDSAGQPSEDAWQEFGLDLDGACTNSSTCPGLSQVSCMSKTMTLPFDGQLCRDNTFARLQPVVAAVP